jgi:hypothetical protein
MGQNRHLPTQGIIAGGGLSMATGLLPGSVPVPQNGLLILDLWLLTSDL